MQPFEKPIENLDAEQAMLGAMLMNNDCISRVSYLSSKHFSEPVHQRIFEAMRSVVGKGLLANPLTLGVYFEDDDALEAIGGARYLGQLAKKSGRVIDIQDYAHLVIDLYQRREVRSCIEQIGAKIRGFSVEDPVEEITREAIEDLQALLKEKPRSTTFTQRQVAKSIIEQIEKTAPAYSTGFSSLDQAMDGGIYPEKVYGFAARKKVGKTVLAGTISYQLNKAGVKHLFIAGEMSPEEIETRNMARGLQVYPSVFRNKQYRTKDFSHRVAQYAVDAPNNVIYEAAPGLTFSRLKEVVQLAIIDHGISGFILDYWQLVGGKPQGKSTSEHLDEVAQWIADFCRKNKLWALVMAQINQEGNTRGGEGMRLAFDQVYQIHREVINSPDVWFEMLDTRYTAWANIGEKGSPGFSMNNYGPYFEEI